MTLTLLPKPSLDDFIRTCTPLAIIEPLEAEFRERVESIAQSLLEYQPDDDPVENLKRFLCADRDFLGIILSLTNLSQEKFLRILSAERFAQGDFGPEWGIDRVHQRFQEDAGFTERVARLFLQGHSSPVLIRQVAAFYLDQLTLPENWDELIRDPAVVQSTIRRKLQGEYTDKKGEAIESIIRAELDRLQEKYGVPHGKG